MIEYWVSFTIIALLIPLSVFGFIGWSASKMNPKPTKEQYAHAGAKGIALTLFYWLCDLFYMACFQDYLVWKFIFGGTIMVIVFANLAMAFSNPNTKRGLNKIWLIQDFLVGIGLTVYLIYLIPNPDIQQVVIPIVSAIYGGLITLVGVAWTIKKSDKDRKDEEEKKAKPLFTFNMLDKEPVGKEIKKLCVPEDLELSYPQDVYVEFENSDRSIVQLVKLYHDGKWFELQGNTVMLPNKTCFFSFRYNSPLNIFLVVKDTFDKEYYYHVKVVFKYQLLGSSKKFNTLRELKEIPKEEVNKLIKEGTKYE